MAKKDGKMDYDSAYAELQDIVNKIQEEDIKIEMLSVYIKRANELKLFCEQRLREIEEDIQQAIK
jgi:exodeoxyribonuclease VII small subunit